jgi:hypothetical protein
MPSPFGKGIACYDLGDIRYQGKFRIRAIAIQGIN